MYANGFCNTGWKCPSCGRVYAPGVAQCFYCGGYTPVNKPEITWIGWSPDDYTTYTLDNTNDYDEAIQKLIDNANSLL